MGGEVFGCFFFFQAEDGIRDYKVTGVQTCALPIYGTFSDAARAVHLTQPALSRSIRALEDELRAQLFDRGARRARLTVFGELVAERARRMRLEETQLRRDLELLRGGQEGALAIGVAPAPAALDRKSVV